MDHDKLVAEIWYPKKIQSGENIPGKNGSGLLIADGWVMTAHHVVAEEKQPAVLKDTVEVRLQGDWLAGDKTWYPYQLYWSDPLLDIALLKRIDDQAAGQTTTDPLPCAQLADNTLFSSCQCIGFPKVLKVDKQNNTASLRGNIDTANLQRSYEMLFQVVTLGIKQETGWKGLSGSVVLYQGQIVGVVIEASKLFQDNALLICPIVELFNHQDFSQLQQAGLNLPSLITCCDKSQTDALQKYDEDDLPDLVCYLDRGIPVSNFKSLLIDLQNEIDSPVTAALDPQVSRKHRSFVCALMGEKKHGHKALIERFRRETLPNTFSQHAAYQKIALIDFPRTVKNVEQDFQELQQRLLNKLGILDEPERLLQTLNNGGTSRIFYSVIHNSSYTDKHQELLKRWIQFWRKLGDETLTGVVGLILCLYTDGEPPEPEGASFWKFWEKKAPVSLADFQFVDVDPNCKTLTLDFCSDEHIYEWIDFLRMSADYRWSVKHLKPIANQFSDQDNIAVTDVKKAILNHLQNQPQG
ncbi:MAG: serine protease [Pseudomonadales bacterium]|nr:serine protease [Pseudomonadales bacterium]